MVRVMARSTLHGIQSAARPKLVVVLLLIIATHLLRKLLRTAGRLILLVSMPLYKTFYQTNLRSVWESCQASCAVEACYM